MGDLVMPPIDELEAIRDHDGRGLPSEALAASQRYLAECLIAALRAKEEAEREETTWHERCDLRTEELQNAEARDRELECIVDEYLAPDSEWAFGELEARVRAWKEATGA